MKRKEIQNIQKVCIKKRSEELNYYKKIIQNDKEKTQQKNNAIMFLEKNRK